jgi:hypothetical protein
MDIVEGTGYTVEFAIPWDSVGVSSPSVDDEMGLEVVLNDRDGEGLRDMIQFMGEADLAWGDPSLWGAMRLGSNDSVTFLNTKLDAPVLTATSSGNTVSASWESVPGAIGYLMIMDGEIVEDVTETSTTFEVQAATAKTFDFQLHAYADGRVMSPTSNSVTLDIVPALSAVTDLSGSTEGAVISLTWSAIDDATGYKIYQDTVEVGDTSATEYQVSVSENGLYTFTVVAYNADGVESAPSNGALINVTGVVGIHLSEYKPNLVYPNPAKDKVYLNVSNTQSVKIISMDGRHIDINGKHRISNDRITLNISELKPGLYIIYVQSDESTYHTSFMKK